MHTPPLPLTLYLRLSCFIFEAPNALRRLLLTDRPAAVSSPQLARRTARISDASLRDG